MTFFEPLAAVQNRSHDEWDRGLADFKKLGILGKAAAAGVGLGSAAGGAVYAIPKTVGVTACEFYSQSFGATRGKTLFDYVTGAPVLQMVVTGAIAEGVGAALRHFHVVLPWSIIPTTFLWGALSYLSAQWFRYLPPVVGFSAHGAAGNSMHWVKNRLKPEVAPPATGQPVPPRLVPQPGPMARPSDQPAAGVPEQIYDFQVATRSQLRRAGMNQPPKRAAV